MAESTARQTSDICAVIQKATYAEDLKLILNNIDLSDLQSILQDYVVNQASPRIVAKLHRCSFPLTSYIGTDCLQHTLGFLDYSDMCKLTATNQLFRDLLKKEKDRLMNRQLLGHEAFFEFIYSEQDSRDLENTKFALQYKYSFDDLNQYSFDEMGEKGILNGEDMALWQICHYFGWKKQMFAVFDLNGGPFGWYEGPWRPISELEGSFPILEWKMFDVAGADDCECWREGELQPVVEVECPDKTWWTNFTVQNIKGNLYEQLLKVHPAFNIGQNLEKESEYLIGYIFHHQYKPAVWEKPIIGFGERNILQGMDMIIWKLCKHFGFEMSLCIIDWGHNVCPLRAEHLLGMETTDEYVRFDVSENDWKDNEVDYILGSKILDVVEDGTGTYAKPKSTDTVSWDGDHMAMQIKCIRRR